jgi:hypothetical protein
LVTDIVSNRPNCKIEKWSDLISELNIDMSKCVNYVTAKQIKQITNEEPRLMAKMDRIENLPKVFSDNNAFLLPVSRKEYVIVKGKGYHKLEPITGKPITHTTRIPFPISALGSENESVFLEYANSCGLLKRLLSRESDLILTFRGRRVTPKFSFNVSNSKVTVDGAQIEVDAGFESYKEIILFEAKIGIPSSFNIRQLYYPYRTLFNIKPVRNFLFCFKPEQKGYLFWEYEFNPYDNFESINLIQCKQYQIKVSNVISVRNYQNISPVENKINIPQADDVNKIIQFPLRVFEGYDTSEKMIDAFGFVKRQSSYYRHAAEILGLVEQDNNRYKLTDRGEEYLRLPAEKKIQLCL